MFKIVLRFLLKLIFRVEVHGDQSAFFNERTLIVANHESFLDGLLLGLSMPIEAMYVVHSQIANRAGFRFLLRFVPHLAIDATNPLALKQIIKLVETGKPVVIFPEGRLTKTGSLMKVYDGAAFVAAKTGATIVPVRIDGAGRSYFSRLKGVYPQKLFPKVRLSICPRQTIKMPDLPRAKERRARCGEMMRRILLNMLVATRVEKTLFAAFLESMRFFGRKHYFAEDLRFNEQSYGQIFKSALGLSRLIEPLTKPNEIVGVLIPNATSAISLIFGLSMRSRIPALLNYTAGRDGILSACTAANIKTILTSRQFLQKANLGHLLENLPNIKVHYLEDLRAKLSFTDKWWILWFYLFPDFVETPQKPDDAAIVLFTSGSEGKPKGVVHTHNSILANVMQIRAVVDFTPHDKIMMVLPVFHAFGLLVGVFLPVVSGCRVFLYPNPLHYRIIPEMVYDRDCTILFGTSIFLGNYAKYAHPYDFGRLRYVVAGAEKLSAEVKALWIEKFGISILEGYGVTECAPVISVNSPMACKAQSVGQIFPCLESRLEAVPGIEKGGILHVKGPNVMKGYLLFEEPGKIVPPVLVNHGKIWDGWYATGDIVEMDDDGFIFIRGRVKRFAKIAGEMVSLESVERIANKASPNFAHAATARVDSIKGEVLVLFTTDPHLGRETLISAAKSLNLPELSIPRIIQVIETIPLLGSGKVDHVSLKQMAAIEIMTKERDVKQ